MRWSIKNETTRKLKLLAPLIVALSISGCLITYDLDGVEFVDPVGHECAPDEITLRLIAPTEGQVVRPDVEGRYIVEVIVQVCGINLRSNWGQPNVAGEGFLAVSINERLAHPADQGIAASHFGIVLPPELAVPGNHVMKIEVRNNDFSSAGFPIRQVTFVLPGDA